jgi:hypothetical protein
VRDNPAFDDLIDIQWEKEQVDFGVIERRILSFADKVDWTKEFEDGGSYGDNATNDVSIYKNGRGNLTDFSFRINLVQIDSYFINNILTIAKELDALLLDKQGNLFAPTHEKLADNIKNSDSFQFVNNPTDFLDKLHKEISLE